MPGKGFPPSHKATADKGKKGWDFGKKDLSLKGLFPLPKSIPYFIKRLLMAAKIEPDMLCQTLNTAPGKAAAMPKNCLERAAARPEFCIPTSMAMVMAVR